MSLVFAAIAPHGTLPEAPVENADATHAALATLGERFDAARPEVTIVLTPHNVHVERHFAVVLAGTMDGSLALFDAPGVHLTVPVDVWLTGTRRYVVRVSSTPPVTKVVIDPDNLFPDVNRANQSWSK